MLVSHVDSHFGYHVRRSIGQVAIVSSNGFCQDHVPLIELQGLHCGHSDRGRMSAVSDGMLVEQTFLGMHGSARSRTSVEILLVAHGRQEKKPDRSVLRQTFNQGELRTGSP